MKAHHEAGKDKASFMPSPTLLDIIKEESLAKTHRNHAMEDYDKMIKANLAVLNSASIKEVRQGCKLHSFFISLDEETYEHQEEDIKQRKEYWESEYREYRDVGSETTYGIPIICPENNVSMGQFLIVDKPYKSMLKP
jgi:hypothetical protein